MPSFKPAYLIHGDDHGRIAERRARLRQLAEGEGGAGGLEIFDGEGATPEAVAGALAAMTFAVGRRFLIVDGVERWRERDLEPVMAALAAMPPETTIAFFAREERRQTVPDALRDAVVKAGGTVEAENAVKPQSLPAWAVARARELGLELDAQAALALVAHVGERQQRLLRELEKLALELGDSARVGIEEIQQLTASSAERKVWSLADALLARDAAAATGRYLELREQGERLGGLLYWAARRLREALGVADRLAAGESAAAIRRGLRMPPRAADELIKQAHRSGPERLRSALIALADLELTTRGGNETQLSDDTATIKLIREVAG